MKKIINLEGRLIGDGQPCFIIGEIGSNHNRDKQVVRSLIDACSEAKFDAVKFQIYDAEEAFSKNEMTTDVRLDHLYGKRPWWEVARDVILMPREWFGEMFDYARSKNLIPLSAIHRPEDLDFLLQFGLSVIKIASIDLHYHHLLKDLARYNLPMIISTGMAYVSEIDETLRMLEAEGCDEIILLHCVSCYPPKPEDVNLRNITTFKNTFGLPIGFSDHSTGIVTSVSATTLGAAVIEKHITLDKKTPGPDHHFAIEPQEMAMLVDAIRETEVSLGNSRRSLSQSELDARVMIRRSIIAKKKIYKGQPVILNMVKFARPGTGITTNEFRYVDGRLAKVDIPAETIIQWNMVE
mgnify:CR=1 FL=1